MFCVALGGKKVTFALYIFKSLVFITEAVSVYSAVRTESLYNTDTVLTDHFLAEIQGVYCAVRAEPLNKRDLVSVFFPPLSLMPPNFHTNFRGPCSWLWRKCNRFLRLGHP